MPSSFITFTYFLFVRSFRIFHQNQRSPGCGRGSLTSGAIRDYFRQLGFSDEELVALLGAVAPWFCGPLRKEFESR